jgi:hypothetical protein
VIFMMFRGPLGPKGQGRKSRSSCRISNGFDSVAKDSECSDHSQSVGSPGLFAHRRAAFLIAERHYAKLSKSTDRGDAQSPDGFVVS